MEVMFVNPSYQPHWSCNEPTGLLQLASVVRKINDVNVSFHDFNTNPSLHDFQQILNKRRPDLVCIGIITRQADEGYKIGRFLKGLLPDVRVVYGGVHATFMSDEPFERGVADYVIIGEGEKTLPQLIIGIMSGETEFEIPGIKHNIRENDSCSTVIQDLDELPFPAYDLIDFSDYNTSIHIASEKKNAVHIMTSRGCTNNCTYCASPALYKRKLRFRSPANVVDEIEYLRNEFGIQQVHFHDDNFILDKERVRQMCELIIKKGIDVEWIILGRADTIAKSGDLLKIMKKAGCIGIEIGVEANDDGILNFLNKDVQTDQIFRANEKIKQAGIIPMYLMMCYLPNENLDSCFKSAKMLFELKYGISENKILPYKKFDREEVQSHFMRLSPGAEIYDDSNIQGIDLTKTWGDHYEERINFLPKTLLDDIPMRTHHFESPKEHLLRSSDMLSYFVDANFYIPKDLIWRLGSGRYDKKKLIFFLYELLHECDGATCNEIYLRVRLKWRTLLISDIIAGLCALSILRLVESGRKNDSVE